MPHEIEKVRNGGTLKNLLCLVQAHRREDLSDFIKHRGDYLIAAACHCPKSMDLEDWLPRWAAQHLHLPRCPDLDAKLAVAIACKPGRLSAEEIAKLLRVTFAKRRKLKLWTFGACDLGPQEREARAKARKKPELDNKNFNRTIDRSTISNVREAYRRFKIVLQADLSILHSYFVTQKGGFDTISLLAFGENLFPPDLGMKVPEAIFDCREAGKCLAYELPTACGFHVFRATESVLRKYYLQVSGSKVPPKVRNIGVYLNAMNQAGIGDEKIKFALKQMAELYRNPLIHPEAVLTQEEAIGVFGLARSAIAGMLAALPVLPPTTSTVTAQNISGPQPVAP